MKKTAVKILCFVFAAAALLPCAAGEGGEVLWWLIGSDYASITGTTTDGRTMTAGDLGVTDARIRYENSTDGSSGYLTLYGLNEGGSVERLEGVAGAGLPAEYFADISGCSGASYSFVVELGNWSDGRWVHTSMESAAVSYNTLAENRHIAEWAATAPTYATPWTPGAFAVVPEPTSGILILVGGALLALRRKRNGIA